MFFFSHLNNLDGRRMQFFGIVFFLMLYLGGQSQNVPTWQTGAGNVVEASGITAQTSGTINVNVTRPANIVPGDLVIFILTQQNSNAGLNSSSMVPAGFTLIKAENAANVSRTSMSAYFKIAGNSEPTNYTVALSINNSVQSRWKAIVVRVTGHNPTNPIAGTSGASVNSNTISIPSINTTTNNSLLIFARSVRGLTTGNTFTGGGTMTQRWLANGSGTSDATANSPSFQGITETIASAGATGTRAFSWSVSNDASVRTAGIMFAINPTPPVVPSSFVIGTQTPNKSLNNVPGYGAIALPTPPALPTYPSNRNYNTLFGRETTEASTGVNRVINSFNINTGPSAGTYVRGFLGNLPFTKVIVKRETGGPVTGNKITAFFETAAFPTLLADGSVPNGTNVFLRPEYAGTLPEIINSYTFNRGADNVFANADATQNNVGRIDLIFEGGITASNVAGALNKSGILMLERGANDEFKYAAITSLNAQKEVATLGILGTVGAGEWGLTAENVFTMVFQRDANDPQPFLRPSQHIESQPIAGTFITLANMGIAAQQVFYGISIFPGDVTSQMNLITLAGFPTNTPSTVTGGLDFTAGGGFFAEAVNISGNVWNDVNGNAINSGELFITNGSVWANLVDPATNDVIQSVQVSGTGAYTFPNLTPNTSYRVILSSTSQTGNLNLIVSSLPGGFVHTGVNLSAIANTGNKTGIIAINSGLSGLINQNFGIEQPPTAGSGNNSAVNPNGTLLVNVPANTFTNGGNSTDITPGNVTGIRITDLPEGATTIEINSITYNASNLSALTALIIPTNPNGSPAWVIRVDPTLNSGTSVRIPFKAIDNAGQESSNTGIAQLTLTAISITGTVWNDASGNAIKDVAEPFIINGSVFANLVDPATDDVLQSVVVSGTGVYTFPGVTPNSAYKVILSTSSQTGNVDLTVSTLPANWVNTGVNLGGTANTSNKTGVISINAGADGLTAQNFGIQQPPTPGSGINYAINPESNNQVIVPANTFTNGSNSTDVSPGSIFRLRLTALPTSATSMVINGIAYSAGNLAALTSLIIPADLNGNPAWTITVDPSFSGAGNVTINFVVIDNAGAESAVTGNAVLTLNCAEYRSITSGLWSSFGINGTWEKKIEPFTGDVWEVATNAPPSGALVRVRDSVVMDVDYTVYNCPIILDNITQPIKSKLTINPNITLSFGEGYDGNAYFNSRPVVVKSTAVGTGAIGKMFETGTTLGQYSKTFGDNNVTVERYIPDTKRRWNLLTFGVSSSTATILDAWGGSNGVGDPRKRVEMSSNRTRYTPALPYGTPSPAALASSTPSLNGVSVKPDNFPVINTTGFPEPSRSDYVAGDGTIITGHRHIDAATANARGYDWWPELNIPLNAIWWIREGTAPDYTYRSVRSGQLVTTPSSIRPFIPGSTSDFTSVRGVDWVSNEYINTGFGETSQGSGLVDPTFSGNGLINVSLSNAYNTYKAFMLYTRGDRRVLENWYNATTLRPTGQIYKLNVVAPVNTSVANPVSILANPYPAPIDFELLLAQGDNSTIIQPFFYIWDSRIDGASGNGGWRTVFRSSPTGPWYATIKDSVPPADDPIQTGKPQLISSSQGFMVQGIGNGGPITFTESMKAPITQVVVLPFDVDEPEIENKEGILFANFNTRSTTTGKLGAVDGVAIVLGNTFKADLTDQTDIKKAFSFTGESSISLMRNNEFLSVEGYPIPTTETIFPLVIKNLSQSTYSLTFNVDNMFRNGREAYIRDKFLSVEQPIHLSEPSKYDFSGTADVASTNSNRFEIVFKQSEILPVTFTSINAVEQQKDIFVTWAVATEENMSHYEVEHSLNGTEFEKAVKVDAQNTSPASYEWLHIRPGAGMHFYRVRAINKEGRYITTRIVKVTLGDMIPGFKAFPTVVSTNRQVTLQLISLEKDSYNLQVTDMAGRVISSRTIEHKGGSSSMMMQLPPALTAGKYNITLYGKSGSFIQALIKD